MSDKDGFIWMNGNFVDWREAKIHVLTHSLHYGMSVFEGIRCYEIGEGSAVFRLPDHVKRLFNSANLDQAAVILRSDCSGAVRPEAT